MIRIIKNIIDKMTAYIKSEKAKKNIAFILSIFITLSLNILGAALWDMLNST
jgi:hypothetical protein